jgi:hypothetical protein
MLLIVDGRTSQKQAGLTRKIQRLRGGDCAIRHAREGDRNHVPNRRGDIARKGRFSGGG